MTKNVAVVFAKNNRVGYYCHSLARNNVVHCMLVETPVPLHTNVPVEHVNNPVVGFERSGARKNM